MKLQGSSLFYSLLVVFVFCSGLVSRDAMGLENPGETMADVGVNPTLGTKLDLSLKFQDSEGKIHTLSELIQNKRPSIIVPVYYDCPRLCGLVLDGVVEMIDSLGLELGNDYHTYAISFDPTETPQLANKRLEHYRGKLADQAHKDGLQFFVGEANDISSLMQHLGFSYIKDRDEFAHAAAIFVISPEGEIAQYFTGVTFEPGDARLALVDASKGRIGSALDHVMLFCFRFDPTKGKYTWAVTNLLRLGGGITVLVLGGLIITMLRRERRQDT